MRYLFLLLPLLLFSKTVEIDKTLSPNYYFLGDTLEGLDDNISISGNAVLINSGYFVTAQSAKYDKERRLLHLKGGVKILKDGTLALSSEEVFLDLRDDNAFAKPFFIQDHSTGIWVTSSQANFNKDRYDFGRVAASSCSLENPFWRFEASEGYLDTNTKWLHLYNPKIYIKDIPVFYMPYLFLSTNRERTSGLLMPKTALSEKDGLMYMQPFFYAPSLNWDVEFRPLMMSNRGGGLGLEFRFIDSLDSSGSFYAGYYSDMDDYKEKNGLKNSDHYGYGLYYQSSSFLEKYSRYIQDDGLYVDANFVNDIDYLNIEDFENEYYSKERTVTSKLNYHIKDDDDFYGLYARYFIDTSKHNNKNTIQNLPTLNYHRFSKPIFFDNLLYSLDMNFKNFTRGEGYRAREYNIDIPVSIYFPLLNDYLTLGIKQSLYFSQVNYDDMELIDYGRFLRTYHEISLKSDLIKEYKDFDHVLNLSMDYVLPGIKGKEGLFMDIIELPNERERLNFGIDQYAYDKKSNLKLYHRLKQSIHLDSSKYRYSNLKSEFGYFIDDELKFDFDFEYSFEESKISNIKTYLDYKKDGYGIGFGHFYRDIGGEEPKRDSFLQLSANRDFRDFTIYGNLGYDYENDRFKNYEIGIGKEERCFYYRLAYKRSLTPIMTSFGSDSFEESFLFFEFRFVPLGGLSYKFLDNTKDSNEF